MGGDALMREVAEGLSAADLRPLFDAIDDDIVWRCGSTVAGVLPYGGVYRGRRGVVQLTSELAHAYSTQTYTPKEIIRRGTTVWGWFEVTGECVPAIGGLGYFKRFAFDAAIRWRLRRGRVVEHLAFYDANALIRQTG